MEKFLNLPVYPVLAGLSAQTSVTPVGSADLTDTGSLFAYVMPGDIVHQSTDNIYYEVVSKIDDNNLDLKLLSNAGALPIVSGKEYYIHSGSVNNRQLVSLTDITLIEQTTASTCDIHYDTGAGASDMITLTHTPVPFPGSPDNSEDVRDLIEDSMVEALTTKWTKVSFDADILPYKIIAINLY